MVSNNTGWRTHYLQGLYGNLGLLMPPDGLRGPYPHLPYALDNGAYGCHLRGEEFKWEQFMHAVEWANQAVQKPRWIVVPDVVGDAETTLRLWNRWSEILRSDASGIPLALAVQDGMEPQDVSKLENQPDVIFIGGSTEWKEYSLESWTSHFPKVHVGRINGLRMLNRCEKAGAESCDGTGWFRGDEEQLQGLVEFLRRKAPLSRPPGPLYWPKAHGTQNQLFP